MSVESELAKRAVEVISPGSSKFSRYAFIMALVLLIVIGAGAYFAWQKHANTENRLQQAVVLTEQQATDINYLQNELKENKKNAEMLATEIKKVKAGKVQPVASFSVQAPTVEDAAGAVKDRIKVKDQTLPPAVLLPSDRTLSVPQEVKQPDGTTQWQVGVYKVNNYHNWEWSAGYGQHGGDHYVPVELQRNFSKNAAVSYEHHFGGKPGWEVKYIRKTDKSFILF